MHFYHLKVGVVLLASSMFVNKTKEEIFNEYICPFITGETTTDQDAIIRMSSYSYLKIYVTEVPVSSDWPIKKSNYESEWKYRDALESEIQKYGKDITHEIFTEAVIRIESGTYKEIRRKIINESNKTKYCFFICPFGEPDVDHNYEFVISPLVKRYQYDIQRADEISHTRPITDIILQAINKSRFIIADLSGARPNCYYELGYAHALSKPVIIIAKNGTDRHFDLAGYKWNYWDSYKDLKPLLEKEVGQIITELENQLIGPKVTD